MKFVIFFQVLFFCSISVKTYAQKNSVFHPITLKINELQNDTVQVMYYPLSNPGKMKTEEVVTNGNKLVFKPDTNEPLAIAFVPKKSYFKRKSGGVYMPQSKFIELIYLPGEKIEINGLLTDFYLEWDAKGSSINEAYVRMRDSYKDEAIDICKINLEINDFDGTQNSKEHELKLFENRGILGSKIGDINLEHLRQYLDDDFSAYILCSNRISLESFADNYSRMSEKVKNGVFKNMLETKYKDYLKFSEAKKSEAGLKVGDKAPNFTLKDNKNNNVSLSDFAGELIVLDFWGTWCSPCVSEMPILKSYYEKNNKKIRLIGISCGDTIDSWRNFLIKNELNWIQLFNSKDDSVSTMYGVLSFPTKVIIDENFNILHKFIGVNNDFYKELDLLLK